MGEYGGRSFSKKPSHAEYSGTSGDRGIPPQMPSNKGTRKGIEFLGKVGDKGLGYVKGTAGTAKAPKD